LSYKKEKVERIIRECDKHLLRIDDATVQMDEFMPLTTQDFQNLSKLQVQIIDQFLFRFAKLQDSIGERLFKTILLFLEEDIRNKPFIDILNRLEKLEILTSVEEWRSLRDIRNTLAHTYDDDPEELALAINRIFSKKESLIAIYQKTKRYFEG